MPATDPIDDAAAPTVSGRFAVWARLGGGLALAATSGWALWMGLAHDQAPWCAVP